MIMRKAFFVSLLLPPIAWANMRAPVHIDRGSAQLKSGKGPELRVMGEVLQFQCPESYTGKPDFELFAIRACDARVRYKIQSTTDARVKLEFIFSGAGNVAWRLNTQVVTSMAKTLKVAGERFCTFCPEDLKTLRSAEADLPFAAGENHLEISYRQALSYDERGHGYFRDGDWTQGFTYELWPIAEWKWAENVKAELQFNIVRRPGFLGIGYKDDSMKCVVEENGKTEEIVLKREKPTGILREVSAVIPLKKATQRLRCWYSAE